MTSTSDYLEQQIFNHIFRSDTFSKPTTIAIGLCPSPPSDAGYTELTNSGNSYARIPNASGNGVWGTHGTGGPGSNSVELSFPTATADWGWISGVIITDSNTYNAGNLLLHGALTTPKFVQNGDTFKFAIGDLDITIQ